MNPFALLIEPNYELLARLAPTPLPPTRAARMKRKPAKDYANPWQLLPSEERFMRALVTHGGAAEAAKALGIAVKTANVYIRRIKDRMGLESTMHIALVYDRWARGQG